MRMSNDEVEIEVNDCEWFSEESLMEESLEELGLGSGLRIIPILDSPPVSGTTQ